ncbi:right-handed parallel beta-helix repeat-containing protein [Thalassotalea sp. HSM 43]|uniref:right-handed parallel beta-helix repeat-containing protein n=1 Tax=Thalassotalea sp. HSM 43 TaxID=2552945 RepID=UPI00108073DB|nr:right-handed parallel beta-helix repeat-containing protein [Thalassotalea sp. HSM 43]QBY04069.1 right-handed parallel beta-helix repeat-containing protein [Thalassotalea sp. HSM 43]
MKTNIIKGIILLLASSFATTNIFAATETGCFVIANTEANKTQATLGSKNNPYSSLDDVQADTSCDVIHVLYSDTELDGQIILRDGQKIFGKKGKNGELPVITNSLTPYWFGSLDGIAVVLAKDNKLKNLHFKDTQNTSILGFNLAQPVGGKIDFDNLVVSGANQAGIVNPLSAVGSPSLTIISDEDMDVSINNSDIGQANVMSLYVSLENSNGSVQIKDTIIHDQAQLSSDNPEFSPGIFIIASGSSDLAVNIKDTKVDNIGSNYISNSDGLLLLNDGTGHMEASVDGYHFTNPDGGGAIWSSTGIEMGFWDADGGGSFTGIVKNSRIDGAYQTGIQVVNGPSGGNNTLNVELNNNEISNSGRGIWLLNTANPYSSSFVDIRNNIISNSTRFGLQVGAGMYNGPMDSLEIMMEENTIQNSGEANIYLEQGVDPIANVQVDAGLGSLGSAGKNRILSDGTTETDIYSYGMTISAINNWWGSATGPETIVEENGGVVDVEPSLVIDPLHKGKK